jgi:hypothetical protein
MSPEGPPPTFVPCAAGRFQPPGGPVIALPGAYTGGAREMHLADDHRWATTSHGAAQRPGGVSAPEIMSDYRIDRIGLLKADIEGGEFAVFGDSEDPRWLERVDQMVLEVHSDWGDATSLIDRLRQHGYSMDLRENSGIPVTSWTGRVDYAYCRMR